MLYYFLVPLADSFPLFNLLRYLTFRTGAAILTALLLTFVIAPVMIRWLRRWQGKGQPIRGDGPESHFSKKGTPTMGGLMILLSLTVSTVLWGDITSPFIWVTLMVTLLFGVVGFADDYLKVSKYNPKGLAGKMKLMCQFAVAAVVVWFIQPHLPPALQTTVAVPFFKNVLIDLGWLFPVFACVVIVGASNAVNLTDGLDGLATGSMLIATACFALITWLVGNAVFAGYLQLHAVPGTGELAVFCGALIGALLGFLWYNAQPAQVFMGDTGSLAMGGSLGAMSVLTKHELVLAIIGGVFVAEAVSVMLQVGYYKRTQKRIFLMAPLHHHFEKKGWPESKVVIRFWIISLILALMGLATLKLR